MLETDFLSFKPCPSIFRSDMFQQIYEIWTSHGSETEIKGLEVSSLGSRGRCQIWDKTASPISRAEDVVQRVIWHRTIICKPIILHFLLKSLPPQPPTAVFPTHDHLPLYSRATTLEHWNHRGQSNQNLVTRQKRNHNLGRSHLVVLC